ncbi:MAG TPA: BamA/TamA family outer membrane protein [Gemmatimonadaceae bacterium]|nr:BamA/TamA family outer membrane protein [Gemmatimonadaceae bacterium]
MSWRVTRHVAPLAVALVLAVPAAAGAQDLECDPGDVRVDDIEFHGNETFPDDELEAAIATTPSSFWRRVGLFFGAQRCLDRVEFERDVLRLRLFYRQRGFYKATVDTVVTTEDPGRVDIDFNIAEGPPVLIDTLRVSGLDTVRDGPRMARDLEQMRGGRFDRQELQRRVAGIIERLRGQGFARAEVLSGYEVDEIRDRATVDLQFIPGRVMRIASIDVDIQPREGKRQEIPEAEVRRLISLRVGEIFREQDLFRSQRDLYQLETYAHVEIRLAADSLQPPGDSLLAVRVLLSEAAMHSVRVGAGWATLDCFRTQGRFVDRDFIGGARRLEVNARLSKIGVGYPLDGVEQLCASQVRNDVFSDTVNYYAGATVRQPLLFGIRLAPSLTLFSERYSELDAYLRRTTIGGVASITRETRPRTPLTLAYQLEYGRTQAADAVFCAVFNVCELQAISELTQNTQLATARLSLSRDRTDNLYDPRRGDIVRLEWRHSSRLIGSDFRFNKWTGEANWYKGLTPSVTFASRLQLGGVLALGTLRGADDFVPPQERMYGGGPNSVRGYRQNELGPLVYLVNDARVDSILPSGDTIFVADDTIGVIRTSPTGGNALAIANVELRMRPPFLRDLLQFALFVDGGQVYNRRAETVRLDQFRWTPGVGLRIASPVGPIRFDLAYNRYAQQRGPAYTIVRDEVTGNPSRLRCVSPGNTLPNGFGEGCPASFTPRRDDSFFQKLTFHFSIGQAF